MDNVSLLLRKETIEHDGATWTIARPSYETRLEFATFLERRAIEFARRNRKELAEDYQAVLAAIADRATSGQYGWGGELFAQAISNDDIALKEAVRLVLVQSHKDLAKPAFDTMYKAIADQLVEKFLAVQRNPTKPPAEPPADGEQAAANP